MITVVAGSRTIKDRELVYSVLNSDEVDWEITKIIQGGAEGVDSIAKDWAEENNIPVDTIEPDTDKYHYKRAPLERNKVLIERADAAVIIWNGRSSGTKFVLERVREEDMLVETHITGQSDLSEF